MNQKLSASTALARLPIRERRASGVLGLQIFSHWLLDFVVDPPDLPLLFAGSSQVGLAIWSSDPGFVAATTGEVILLAGGLAINAAPRRGR